MKLKLFAMKASEDFGTEVAKLLDVPLNQHTEYYFPDNECYIAPTPRLQENVRGCDVFVIQSMYSDDRESVNDKLIKMFIFCGALKDASAKRITCVMPYLPYCRQDRKTESRAPISTKYIYRLLRASRVKRILSIDVHNIGIIQNAYQKVHPDLLEANNLIASFVKKRILPKALADVVAFSPDSGGLGRTRRFRKTVQAITGRPIGLACLDKTHAMLHESDSGEEIKGHGIMGNVADKSVLIYDDMISSAKTIHESVEACQRHGAKEVLAACCTHGLFVGAANKHLASPFLKNIVITDTIKPFRLKDDDVIAKLSIIKTSHLFAEAITRIHSDESISDLIQNHLVLDEQSIRDVVAPDRDVHCEAS